MRRILCVCLALLMLCCSALADAPTLESRALEAVQKVVTYAREDAMMKQMIPDGRQSSIVQGWAQGNYTAPLMVLRADLSGMVDAMTQMVDSQWASAGMGERMRLRLASGLISLLNTQQDTQTAALSAVTEWETVFADETITGTGAWLMLYADGTPIMVTWHANEGAVLLTAAFLPLDGLKGCTTAEEVNACPAIRALGLTFAERELTE